MPITIVIEMIENQPVRVTGPLHDKNLCYTLLFEAALAIKDYDPKLVTPTAVLPPGILKGRGGMG
jgi:hypothetical protein